MRRTIGLSTILLILASLGAGVVIGYCIAPQAKETKSPVALDDMRAVVTALEPFLYEDAWEGASVCVRSSSKLNRRLGITNTVFIRFQTAHDTKHETGGASIAEAIANLHTGFSKIDAALAPFSVEKTP